MVVSCVPEVQESHAVPSAWEETVEATGPLGSDQGGLPLRAQEEDQSGGLSLLVDHVRRDQDLHPDDSLQPGLVLGALWLEFESLTVGKVLAGEEVCDMLIGIQDSSQFVVGKVKNCCVRNVGTPTVYDIAGVIWA